MAADAARAKALFLNASELADPAERAAYLERECGGDAARSPRNPPSATGSNLNAPSKEKVSHGFRIIFPDD